MTNKNGKMKVLSVTSIITLMYFGNVEAAYINEIHYENAGADIGEAIEIISGVGVDLAGYSLVFYNGSDGTQYSSIDLSGSPVTQIPGTGGAAVTVVNTPSIQNGPDGVALVLGTNNVLQFLSYEGAFIATNGPAVGLTSTDIGVQESSVDLAGMSLQLIGTGSSPDDFIWSAPHTSTFGTYNYDQTLTGGHIDPVPVPAAVWLFGSGLLGLVGVARRNKV